MLVGDQAPQRLGDRFAGVTAELCDRRASDEAVRVRELRQPERNLERVSGKLVVRVHLAQPSGELIAREHGASRRPRARGDLVRTTPRRW
jgi:hypothetical protein